MAADKVIKPKYRKLLTALAQGKCVTDQHGHIHKYQAWDKEITLSYWDKYKTGENKWRGMVQLIRFGPDSKIVPDPMESIDE